MVWNLSTCPWVKLHAEWTRSTKHRGFAFACCLTVWCASGLQGKETLATGLGLHCLGVIGDDSQV